MDLSRSAAEPHFPSEFPPFLPTDRRAGGATLSQHLFLLKTDISLVSPKRGNTDMSLSNKQRVKKATSRQDSARL